MHDQVKTPAVQSFSAGSAESQKDVNINSTALKT